MKFPFHFLPFIAKNPPLGIKIACPGDKSISIYFAFETLGYFSTSWFQKFTLNWSVDLS